VSAITLCGKSTANSHVYLSICEYKPVL
jgi:hypothetical protein